MAYRVYFGRLPDSLSQDDFEKMLEEHGKAKNIEWKSGYAYVDYKHGSDASKTVQNLNGKEVAGNNILVELAQSMGGGYAVAGTATRPFPRPPPPRPLRTPHRVRIENLSSRAKWMELKELLSLAGEVTFADTHKRKTGEGVVEFATRKDMDEAIKTFHNTTFFGKTIKLYDESPRARSRSLTEQKSRSHSRQRSSERKRRSRSKSASPRRKSSRSPRRRSSRRRSRSPRRRRSRSRDHRRRRSKSKTPSKSRNSHKKSKKSKRNSSRSRSKSPRSKKKRYSRSRSGSNSDNNNDRKSTSKKKRRHSSRSVSSDNSDSDKSK